MTNEQEIFQELTIKAIRNLEEVNTYATYLQFGMTPESVINWVGESKDDHPTQEEIDTEVIKLQAEYDAQEYAKNRKAEYPTIEELTIALYDTDDKAALETKRAAVKTKWPKDNSGPVE